MSSPPSVKIFSDKTTKLLKEVEFKLTEMLSVTSAVNVGCINTLKAGGKRIRPALTIICGHHRNSESLMSAAVSAELIHMASLIHDDILDSSKTRRGCPTIFATHGRDYALRTGDYIFAIAFYLLSETKDASLLEILSKSAKSLCIGEIQQRNTAHDYNQTIDQYIEKIKNKTANLFATVCRMGAICADLEKTEIDSLEEYGLSLGIAFQIYDDILDFIGEEKVMGKSIGSDLKDGMMTMPIFFALEELNDKEFLKNVISRQNPNELKQANENDINRAIDIIVNKTQAIKKSQKKAQEYINKALICLNNIKNKNIKIELASLAKLTLERNS